MASTRTVAVKRGTEQAALQAPVGVQYADSVWLAWLGRDTGTVHVGRSRDLRSITEVVDLAAAARMAPTIAADRSGLTVAWADLESGEVCLRTSRNGQDWGEVIRSGLRAAGHIRLASHDGLLWLVRAGRRQADLHTSIDGTRWRRAATVPETAAAPALFVLDDSLRVAWVDEPIGRLLWAFAADLAVPEDARRRPGVLHHGPVADPSLVVVDGQVHLAWSDDATSQVHLCRRDGSSGAWREVVDLHERAEGPPTLVGLHGDLAVAWIRADGTGRIHLQAPAETAIIERSRTYSGDVQGHPTALTRDHHTPFPYLGIVVLPSDWALPAGTTAGTLTAALDATLDEVADYWLEASHGNVEITSDVHPTVVTLPSPMATYFVRARPKLIEGSGVTFPVTLPGTRTLDLAAAGGFTLTITLPSGPQSLDGVVTAINAAIDAAAYAGPADSTPIATRSDVGQVRIRTAGQVDAGDALAVTGGTAMVALGLDAAHRVVYEGSTKQTDHLGLMLRDALRIVAQSKPDPAAFLRGYYGVAISLASNLGWYALRANASMGPKDVSVLQGQKDFELAHYYATSLDHDDTHAHEVGHNLDLPDEYEEGARNVGVEPGRWDGMDSNSFSHPCAWEKAVQSAVTASSTPWVPTNHVEVLDQVRQSVEVLLVPLESKYPTTNPYAGSHPGVPVRHAVKIPVGSGHAYWVENRQRGPYDDPELGKVDYSRQLPGNGIVVTDTVDDAATLTLSRVPVLLVHPRGLAAPAVPVSAIDQVMAATTVAAKQAIIDTYVPAVIPQWLADKVARATKRDDVEWLLRSYRDGQIRNFYPVDTVGEEVVVHEFPDGDGSIRVKVLEVLGAAPPQVYRVRVSWGRQGSWFDLEIRRWQQPPPWESPDIWIDSLENGWDTYEHSDAAANPGVPGNPVRNGDRPWVGHDNRVRARVWNRGDMPANNVRVDFAEVIPPGQSPGYVFDTDYVDIPAGGSAIATGTWRPKKVPADKHACITAQVEYRGWDLASGTTGELNANNNLAQENIGDFYVQKSSPYTPVELPFEFASPLPEPCEMRVEASGLAPGWTMQVTPHRFLLQPGERMQGRAVLEAADHVPLDNAEEGGAPVVSLSAFVRLGCTWVPIGGLSMVAHAVLRSQLDVAVDPRGTGVDVAIRAHDPSGPVANAKVAVALVQGGERMLAVERGQTDQAGEAQVFVPIDWEAHGSDDLVVEVLLGPTGSSGPASTTVAVPAP